MSTLITEKMIKDFEDQEQKWLKDEGLFDEYWARKLDDEKLFFQWLENRFERTAEQFCSVANIPTVFYTKIIDIMMEAAMTGFFFGELRWNVDIRTLIDQAVQNYQCTGEL